MLQASEKTENRLARRDFVDFITDAAMANPELSERFYEECNKIEAKAEDLYQFLLREGYEGVSLEDCTMLLHFLPAQRPVGPAWMPKAY